MSLLRTTLGRSGDLTMQLEIFVEDLISRCALSAASCDMERCSANAFYHPKRRGPQLPGLLTNYAEKKGFLELRSSEHRIAKTSENCQRDPPSILLALLPAPHYRTEGRSSRNQEGRREREREEGKLRKWDRAKWRLSLMAESFPTPLCYTEDQGVPGALQLLYYGLTWSLCRH